MQGRAFHSSFRSKFVYSPSVTMSAKSAGGSWLVFFSWIEPSTTDQSLPVPFCRYECHPFRSCPSNSNCHPSCFSCGVSAFGACARAVVPENKTQPAATIHNSLRFIITLPHTSMPAQRLKRKREGMSSPSKSPLKPSAHWGFKGALPPHSEFDAGE